MGSLRTQEVAVNIEKAKRYLELHDKFLVKALDNSELEEMRQLRRAFGTINWTISTTRNYVQEKEAAQAIKAAF